MTIIDERMKKLLFLLLIFTFASSKVFATVEYLVVNHTTKQLFWAATDKPHGLIAWQSIPQSQWGKEEKKYVEMGYTFTKNPFLIEELIISILIFIIFGIWIKKSLKKREKH